MIKVIRDAIVHFWWNVRDLAELDFDPSPEYLVWKDGLRRRWDIDSFRNAFRHRFRNARVFKNADGTFTIEIRVYDLPAHRREAYDIVLKEYIGRGYMVERKGDTIMITWSTSNHG